MSVENNKSNFNSLIDEDWSTASRKKAAKKPATPTSPTKQPNSTPNPNSNPNSANKKKNAKVKMSLGAFLNPNSNVPNTIIGSSGGGLSSSGHSLKTQTTSNVLWIGNIGPDITEEMLLDEFGYYGTLNDVRILRDSYCAFINFQKIEDAEVAKEYMDEKQLGKQKIAVKYRFQNDQKNAMRSSAGYDPARDANGSFALNPVAPSLWVGNLSEDVDSLALENVFGRYGPVDSVRLISNKRCAFVNFQEQAHAQAALHGLQGTQLGQMNIKINFVRAKPLDQQHPSIVSSAAYTPGSGSSTPQMVDQPLPSRAALVSSNPGRAMAAVDSSLLPSDLFVYDKLDAFAAPAVAAAPVFGYDKLDAFAAPAVAVSGSSSAAPAFGSGSGSGFFGGGASSLYGEQEGPYDPYGGSAYQDFFGSYSQMDKGGMLCCESCRGAQNLLSLAPCGHTSCVRCFQIVSHHASSIPTCPVCTTAVSSYEQAQMPSAFGAFTHNPLLSSNHHHHMPIQQPSQSRFGGGYAGINSRDTSIPT
eukprot:TRINITY_DN4662_c0_g1_i1.p1 TRINITY_DN4662_c0_g1~~TRINITY_DN4662_c0_g1_i1.p1  ORF type:complete len:567 (+),score=122.21 TRINITY_DN4662_c0_g1_i1:117-1703(+)